ncbi:hypothetical protein DV532_29605 (plasmid) [Pseudomonas sp. Leaf58]|uniref:hypothetical protein n=1 Tax=Pseudomonas sp. Leaf58 TaxID=1736226 RepID=UPI0006FDD9D5|nr:hypothetical protein [Pseudomonas sp. Leaf58]AYG48395.1 hypothetical protein DV532_29605 [Pseudomonas sp. Leaf58]KQN62058.1 hypothetical protein ASF02_07705 [Pseudomonas sp. Leaf58]
MFSLSQKLLYTYIATLSLVASPLALAQTPQVQTTSAFIQLLSVLDGTQNDIEIPGLPSPGPEIIGFVAKNRPDLASVWIDEGANLEAPGAINCTDVPEDFLVEENLGFWSYRDSRTLGCSWSGQEFSLKIEVLVEEQGGNSTWLSTDIQSVNNSLDGY